jgi:HD-GYP domain-containing protein (c-di-GMP phosphodiesterase class II)
MRRSLSRLLGRRSLDPLRSVDPASEQLLALRKARGTRPLADREAVVSLVLAGGFVACAVALWLLVPTHRDASPLVFAGLIAAYAVATTVEFDVGPTIGVPSELAFVPMLFFLPPEQVPLAVAVGALLGELITSRSSARPLHRKAVLALVNSWHALGPALVLALAGAPDPRWADAPLYAAALALDVVGSAGSVMLRQRLAFGTRPKTLLRYLGWVSLVDVLLAPVGLVAAVAPAAFLAVIPLMALLRLFAHERNARVEQALELSAAYRRTAVLLGDVVEMDDAYTGAHSRSVVELSLAVADAMGLGADERRNVEFAALLHDVGKLAVPKEIINKPGRLTPTERAVMETHTLTGEEILDRVGGALGDVGRIVRSCHERWDGNGYPDGLAGDDIPLVARIVCACDAYSAITTDRPYRAAHTEAAAIHELRRCSGSQFDPTVVETLIGIVQSAAAADREAA